MQRASGRHAPQRRSRALVVTGMERPGRRQLGLVERSPGGGVVGVWATITGGADRRRLHRGLDNTTSLHLSSQVHRSKMRTLPQPKPIGQGGRTKRGKRSRRPKVSSADGRCRELSTGGRDWRSAKNNLLSSPIHGPWDGLNFEGTRSVSEEAAPTDEVYTPSIHSTEVCSIDRRSARDRSSLIAEGVHPATSRTLTCRRKAVRKPERGRRVIFLFPASGLRRPSVARRTILGGK